VRLARRTCRTSTDHLIREPEYGFADDSAVQTYIDNLRLISHRIPVWPPVDEIRNASHKFQVIKQLDAIASNIMFSARPATNIVELPLKNKPTGVVIKRERSDTSRHCLLPRAIDDMTLKTLNDYLQAQSLPDCRWLAQDFIPELIHLGEWCTYFVAGERVLTTLTEPDEQRHITVGRLSAMWNLEELT
jgi:hypothetical protein